MICIDFQVWGITCSRNLGIDLDISVLRCSDISSYARASHRTSRAGEKAVWEAAVVMYNVVDLVLYIIDFPTLSLARARIPYHPHVSTSLL